MTPIITDPTKFKYGSWYRKGEWMHIASLQPIVFDRLPEGFQFETLSYVLVGFIDGFYNGKIKVKEWTNGPILSYDSSVCLVHLGPNYRKDMDTHGMWHAGRKILTAVTRGHYHLEIVFKRKTTNSLYTHLWLNETHKICEQVDAYPLTPEDGSYTTYSKAFQIPDLKAGDTISLPKHMSDIEMLRFYRLPSPFTEKVFNTTHTFETTGPWNLNIPEGYKLNGELTISKPGIYKIGNQTIRLNNGSFSVILSNENVKEDGTIKIPISTD